MLPAKAVLERIAKVPGLRKRAEEIAATLMPDLADRDARDAATASAAEFVLEGLARPQQAQQGRQAGRLDVPSLIGVGSEGILMSLFEYSRWDGSQEFLPQSADKLFDQLSEYILQYGDEVLRNLEDLDEDEMPEVVELIQKEGLIERDEEGKWRVTPQGSPAHPGQGARRPLPDLPPRQRGPA